MDKPTNGWTLGAYRAHMDRVLSDLHESIFKVLDERDKQYDGRLRAAEIVVNTALLAQEKAVMAAFAASDKAISKAENAQREYNSRSNEFRGQLDDQAKTLMSRTETMTLVRSLEEKMLLNVQNNQHEHGLIVDRLGKLDSAGANLQGKLWAVTAIAWFIMLAVTIALRFFK